MGDAQIIVLSVVAVLSVFLQPAIKAQPTISSYPDDDSCLQQKEELEFHIEENVRLQMELESQRQRIETMESLRRIPVEKDQLRNIKTQPERATLLRSINVNGSPGGVAKVEDTIYVLVEGPNRIRVYEDRPDFRLIREIALNVTGDLWDIVYSNESKCVYFMDNTQKCIWEMTTTGVHQLTKWLTNVTWPINIISLSFSNEGHLLLLTEGFLEIYSLNATRIRIIHLPQECKAPSHIVQTLAGNYIISHRLTDSYGRRFISQLTSDGRLISQFISRNQSEELGRYVSLCLDSENNRLFVTDYDNDRVILFDSIDLSWSHVLLSHETNGIEGPWSLFYDASKRHLFVVQFHQRNIMVFEIK